MSRLSQTNLVGIICRCLLVAGLLLPAPILVAQTNEPASTNSPAVQPLAPPPAFASNIINNANAILSQTNQVTPKDIDNVTNTAADIQSALYTTENTNGFVPTSAQQTNNEALRQALLVKSYRDRLESAKQLVLTRQFKLAETALIALLPEKVPDDIRKEALFELSYAVSGEDDLPRAESILAQYLAKWTGDARTPQILLRQGQLFRSMGLNNLALGKFYSVMTTALSLKSDQLGYYQSIVLQAQIEIAETHYLMGQFDQAADFYSRLLKNSDPGLNRPLAQFRLVRSLAATTNKTACIGQAQDFISHYPDDPEAPEVRYYLAQSLKSLGQNAEALRQVLIFLKQEKSVTQNYPQVWSYWQQRVGNEIANELYQEGDYVRALEIYNSLLKLDDSPSWKIPVEYQIGITYERLLQPAKALASYNDILQLQNNIGTNSTPNLQTVIDMSRWRTNFLAWQTKVTDLNQSLAQPEVTTPLPAQFSAK